MPGTRGPGSRHLSRALLVLAVAVVASLAPVVSGLPPAWAHDELIATTPAQGATVGAAPAAVELELSSPPQPLGTRVAVTGPDGAAASDREAAVRGTTVRRPLQRGLPAGAYTVDWQVTSADGHRLTGSFSFTVAPPAGTAASPAETAAAAPADGEEAAAQQAEEPPLAEAATDSSSATPWIVVAAVLVLAVAIAVAVRRLRRA